MLCTGTISQSDNTRAKYRESKKLRNYKKQSYWALPMYTAGSADVKYNTHFTGEITLHVAQTVNTEQL